MTPARLRGCEIRRIGWEANTTWLIVELMTSNGMRGLGEASMSGDDAITAVLMEKLFAGLLYDKGIDDAPGLIARLSDAASAAESVCEATAASALEQALWDLRGQAMELPLHALLGGARRSSVPLYANINRSLADRSAECFADTAKAAAGAGFRAVKCAPFDEVLPPPLRDDDDSVEPGMERLRAVRSAIGDGVALMVDCHGRLGPFRAARLMPALSELKLKWLEEPVVTHEEMWRVIGRRSPAAAGSHGTDLDGLARLVEVATMPIAGGEFEAGLRSFIELLRTGLLTYLMPDIKHGGGISTAIAAGAAAAAYGVRLSPHNPSGPVSTMGSAHVAATSASCDSLEAAWGELIPDRGLVEPPLEIRSGNLQLPDLPGLGIRLVSAVADQWALPLGVDPATSR